MSEYIAPLRDMQFVLRELAPLEQVATLPGCEEFTLDLAEAILEEAGKFAGGVLSPINASGDREGARWQDGEVLTAGGWKEAYRQFVERRLECAVVRPRARRPGRAAPGLGIGRGNVERGQHVVRLVPDADARRDRGAGTARLGRPEAHLPAEDGQRRVDRHDEPDRAAGRLRPVGGANARRSAARRQLPRARPEDLHHLRRARPHREHRAPRAGTHAGRARGRQGHLAVPRAEVPRRGRRQPGPRATTCAACRSSTSSASTPARRRCWRSATTKARSAGWSAKRTAAWRRCSS